MTKEEIKQLVLEKGLTITDVIDVVVQVNGIIGVGLITLGDQMKEYCYKHAGAQRNAGKQSGS